jgi:hypothetical protein
VDRHIFVDVANDTGVRYEYDGTRHTQGPVITMKSTRNGQKITTPTVVVSGTANDALTRKNGIVSVTVDGIRAGNDTTTGTVTTDSWSKSVDLSLGPNTIPVVATDGLGYTTTKSVTVTHLPDTKGPALTVRTPRNGQGSPRISLDGKRALTGGNGIA